MPLFCVIIPLYNKAPYVAKTIDSVLGQTFTDYELMVIDNGSTDGSGDIIKRYSDPRLRIHHIEENIGVSNARNKGVTLTSAPYITFLDADDWWEPNFLEKMGQLIDRHPNAGIYGTGYYIVKNGRKRVAPIGVDKDFGEGEINYCQVYARTLCMPLTSISVCMPRTIFEKNGGFPPNISMGEDFLLWIHVALNHPVILLNSPLCNYNQDVNPTYRATRHFAPPKEHMLWNLNDLKDLETNNNDYKELIDSIRTYSLMPYLLNRHFHADARKDLAKVDWGKQTPKKRRLYHSPIAYLLLRSRMQHLASHIKQYLGKTLRPS